jgi:hypothetical protein
MGDSFAQADPTLGSNVNSSSIAGNCSVRTIKPDLLISQALATEFQGSTQ